MRYQGFKPKIAISAAFYAAKDSNPRLGPQHAVYVERYQGLNSKTSTSARIFCYHSMNRTHCTTMGLNPKLPSQQSIALHMVQYRDLLPRQSIVLPRIRTLDRDLSSLLRYQGFEPKISISAVFCTAKDSNPRLVPSTLISIYCIVYISPRIES